MSSTSSFRWYSGLLEAIGPLVAWTRAHRDDIAAAQAIYDAEAQPSQ